MIFHLGRLSCQKICNELGLPPGTKTISFRVNEDGAFVASIDFYLTPDQAWALGLILKTQAEEQRERQ